LIQVLAKELPNIFENVKLPEIKQARKLYAQKKKALKWYQKIDVLEVWRVGTQLFWIYTIMKGLNLRKWKWDKRTRKAIIAFIVGFLRLLIFIRDRQNTKGSLLSRLSKL
jgi:hypothetical protein